MRFLLRTSSVSGYRQKLRRRVIICAALVVMLWIIRCACPPAAKAASAFLSGGRIDSAVYPFYACLHENGSIAEAADVFGAFFYGNAS